MSHVFISYSKSDHDYASRLADALLNAGFDVWLDTENLKSGVAWWNEIVAGIRTCAAMIVIMTPRSQASRWVQREVLLADEWGKPMFPLLLEGENWPLFVDKQFEDVRDDGGRVNERLFAALTAAGVPRRLESKRGRSITQTDKRAALNQLEGDPQVQATLDDPPPPETEMTVPGRRPGGRSRLPLLVGAGLLVVVLAAAVVMLLANIGGNDDPPTPDATIDPALLAEPVSVDVFNTWREASGYDPLQANPALERAAAAHAASLGSRGGDELEGDAVYLGDGGETAQELADAAGYTGSVELFVVIVTSSDPVTLDMLLAELAARGGADVHTRYDEIGYGSNRSNVPAGQFVAVFLGTGESP